MLYCFTSRLKPRLPLLLFASQPHAESSLRLPLLLDSEDESSESKNCSTGICVAFRRSWIMLPPVKSVETRTPKCRGSWKAAIAI